MASRDLHPALNEERTATSQPLIPHAAEKAREDQEVEVGAEGWLSGSDGEEDFDPDVCVVQFSSNIFYGDMSEGQVVLDVVRIGSSETFARVKYSTEDASAKSGETYASSSGLVVFAVGEFKQSITIPLIQDDLWSATVEFKVHLSQQVNCKLGAYQHSCRVKLLNDNVFPSDVLRWSFDNRGIQKTPGIMLWLTYCKWNALSASLVWSTLLTLLLDQIQNVYVLVMITCDMYIVNVICNPEASEDQIFFGSRKKAAYLVAAMYFFPHVILVSWQYAKVHMDIEGSSVAHLRKQMYRKYMNFASVEIEAMGPELLEFGLLSEAPKVASGYTQGLILTRVTVNLLMNIYFVAAKRPTALPFIGMVMITMSLWGLWKREEYMTVPGSKKEITKMSAYVKETAQKHDLISTFFIRPQMNQSFERMANQMKDKATQTELHHLNSTAVLSCIAPLCIGIYICLTIGSVIKDQGTLGTWLGIIHIMKNVAEETEQAYERVLDLFQTFSPLRNITTFLNKETEVASLMAYSRARNKTSLNAMKTTADGEVRDFDTMKVYCKEASYSFQDVQVLANVSVRCSQGTIVGLHGPNGSGKNLLMRLIAQQAVATQGEVFVPAHLRTLLVTRRVQFLDRSLVSNLSLGVSHFHKQDLARLKDILRDLQLTRLHQVLDADMEDEERRNGPDTWSSSLSNADLHKVTLARAFFMNPEVLILEKPFAHYTVEAAELVAGLVTRHCRERGLHMSQVTQSHRSLRTVFFTTDRSQDCRFADIVWESVQAGHFAKNGATVWTIEPSREAVSVSKRSQRGTWMSTTTSDGHLPKEETTTL